MNEFILPLKEELLSHLEQWEDTKKSIDEWNSIFLEEVAWVMDRINEEKSKHKVKPEVKEVISCIKKDLPKEKWYKYIFNQSFIHVDRQDDLTLEDKLDILETYRELPYLVRCTYTVKAMVSLFYKLNERFGNL